MRNRMNIFLTASKRSICYAYPAIVSLFEKNTDSEVYLYLASEDLEESDLTAEYAKAKKFGHHIVLCPFDEEAGRKQIICSDPEHWPVGAMSCYWMFHELLPEDVDRILAIESDTVTIGSLKEFYETDLTGFYAACPDADHKPLRHKQDMEELGGGDVLTYVGSLYDVAKIRQDFTLQKILETDGKVSEKYGQSQMELTFGILFQGKIKYIPAPEYSVEENLQSMERFGYAYLTKCEDTCRILHFSSTRAKEKPWNPTCIMPGYYEWWRYAKESPYYQRYFEEQWKNYKKLVEQKQQLEQNVTRKNILTCAIVLLVLFEIIFTTVITGLWYMIPIQLFAGAAAVRLAVLVRKVSIMLRKR